MPKIGETVRVGFNDVAGLVVGFSMEGRGWRTHFPLEEED